MVDVEAVLNRIEAANERSRIAELEQNEYLERKRAGEARRANPLENPMPRDGSERDRSIPDRETDSCRVLGDSHPRSAEPAEGSHLARHSATGASTAASDRHRTATDCTDLHGMA